MEPNRTKYRVKQRALHRQTGVTAIGFLVLASVFGILGLAGLKIVPLYMQKMRISTVLKDLGRDSQTGVQTPQSIRNELDRRFSIEGITIQRDNVKITQVRDGYQVRIQQEERTPFVADLWFVVVLDEQVEIRR